MNRRFRFRASGNLLTAVLVSGLLAALARHSPAVRAVPSGLRDAPAGYAAGDEKLDHFSRFLAAAPDLKDFLNEWPSERAGDIAARFARAAHRLPVVREREWAIFDAILGGRAGGRRLGSLRRELARLPPEQWYFVIRLEDQRGSIFRAAGNGLAGNIAENIMVNTGDNPVDFNRYGRKCYERADRLLGLMKIVRDTGRFNNWASRNVVAGIGRRNEHTAPCFVYSDGAERVEIVADPWGDSLSPAGAWWRKWGDGAFDGSQAGWCGSAYEEYENSRFAELLHPAGTVPAANAAGVKPGKALKQLRESGW